MRLFLSCLACFAVAACSAPPSDPSSEDPAPASGQKATLEQPVNVPSDPSVFAEVVYLTMRDRTASYWFCTGTLVDARTVVTAAHCLDPKMFVAYEVEAPLAPGKPRVSASSPKLMSDQFEDVANGDIGFLTLDEPITLGTYATLTDVVAQVDAGGVMGAAVVRTEEKPYAPLETTDPMPVSSTVQYGYEHGFGTPLFSKGGDSGAGMFLVENGKPTHRLIGVVRQPEPDRGIDHQTRIDQAFLDFFAANATVP